MQYLLYTNIISKFLRNKVSTNFLSTVQSFYGIKFIRGQSLYWIKFLHSEVSTGQSLYGDKLSTETFHTVHK
jgi:hypothetical protein